VPRAEEHHDVLLAMQGGIERFHHAMNSLVLGLVFRHDLYCHTKSKR